MYRRRPVQDSYRPVQYSWYGRAVVVQVQGRRGEGSCARLRPRWLTQVSADEQGFATRTYLYEYVESSTDNPVPVRCCTVQRVSVVRTVQHVLLYCTLPYTGSRTKGATSRARPSSILVWGSRVLRYYYSNYCTVLFCA